MNYLNKRLAERDSVNTPWDKPGHPDADKIRRGDYIKKRGINPKKKKKSYYDLVYHGKLGEIRNTVS